MILVGIAGASGAGKSVLARQLMTRIRERGGHVELINEDSYYRSQGQLSLEEREKQNYDHPDAFEHDLLARHLESLLKGEAVSVPEYDYSIHDRKDETRSVAPPKILVLEGLLILHRRRIRNLLNLKIFVDVPPDVCLVRRLRRDARLRGRTLESILSQYEETVRPMFHRFVKPSKDFADLVVPHGGENSNAIHVLECYFDTMVNGNAATAETKGSQTG